MRQRVTVAIAAMHRDGFTFTRDVTQAYTQSASKLERDVYLRPPAKMRFPNGKVSLLLKALYGIPESGPHWFLTYLRYHKKELHMKLTVVKPCHLY